MKAVDKIKDLMGINFFDTVYKSITFGDFLIAACPQYQLWRVKRLRQKQLALIQSLSCKEKYRVIFFLQSPAVWKYDALYWQMERSTIFDPIVVVAPYNVHLIYDKQECLQVMKKAEEFAQAKGYRFLSAYDWQKRSWKNVKQMIKPDIVFMAKPYKDTLPQYHLYHYQDCLTLYAPYGITCIDIFRTNYNLPFNNLLWRFLVETEFHRSFAQEYSLCKGDNVAVIGALGEETLMRKDYQPVDVWKAQEKKKKRVIWAPHHTVDYLFNFSNFLVYCDEMLRLAEKYKDEVQFAFKPHPVLKFKLINLWGKEKTEEYYHRWESLENGQIAEGDYMDLFLTSDAMIHDCASFTAEYLYTGKPTLFMVRDPQVESHWNRFGRMCYDMHYKATCIEDIEHYIENVVIAGKDEMKQERDAFVQRYLLPQDGKLPSEKIYNLLLETLGKTEK